MRTTRDLHAPTEPPMLAQAHVSPQYNSITPSGQGPGATHNCKIYLEIVFIRNDVVIDLGHPGRH